MKKQMLDQAQNHILAPLSKSEYAQAAYNHLKIIKSGLPESEVEAMTDAKTASYVEAMKTTDEVIAALHAIAATLPAEAKTELNAAISAATGFAMFNGESSMVQNSLWGGEVG